MSAGWKRKASRNARFDGHLTEVNQGLATPKGAVKDLSALVDSGNLTGEVAAAAQQTISKAFAHIDRIEKIMDRARQACTGTRICGR